jgi:hypothetical protein
MDISQVSNTSTALTDSQWLTSFLADSQSASTQDSSSPSTSSSTTVSSAAQTSQTASSSSSSTSKTSSASETIQALLANDKANTDLAIIDSLPGASSSGSISDTGMLQALQTTLLGLSNLSLYKAEQTADAGSNSAGISALESLQSGSSGTSESSTTDAPSMSGTGASSQPDILDTLLQPSTDNGDLSDVFTSADASSDLSALEGFTDTGSTDGTGTDASIQALANSDPSQTQAATGYNSDGTSSSDTGSTSSLFSTTA